jgi:hypothetical protein
MNEEKFNTELRRFLKKVGITAQQEIERAVADAIEKGQISGDETLNATATIRIGEIELETAIDSSIRLE